MTPFDRLHEIPRMLLRKKPTVVLRDPEDPAQEALQAARVDARESMASAEKSNQRNGSAASSESVVIYNSPVEAHPTYRPKGRGATTFLWIGLACVLAATFTFGGLYYWNHLQAPGSTADDEYHAFDRTLAQYDKWCNLILDRIDGGNGTATPVKRMGSVEAKVHLPPEGVVHACLRRHLPGYLTITSVEPLAYSTIGNAEELEYRVTVESPVDIYIVPALSSAPPANAPELVKEVWSDLLWSDPRIEATLPPGMYFGTGEKERYLLVKADQRFSFAWKIEKAQIVDGKWKILRVSPPLLEWNDPFRAAALNAALHGRENAPPLFLCQGRELAAYSASYDRCLDQVTQGYDSMEADIVQAKNELKNEVTKGPRGIHRSIDRDAVAQARSDGFSEGMDKGQGMSDALSNAEGTTGTGAIPIVEAVIPFAAGLFGSKKAEKDEIARQRKEARNRYYAQKARHEREEREATQKGNEYQQQQERAFVQNYQDLARKRRADIEDFIQKIALAEDKIGKGKPTDSR